MWLSRRLQETIEAEDAIITTEFRNVAGKAFHLFCAKNISFQQSRFTLL